MKMIVPKSMVQYYKAQKIKLSIANDFYYDFKRFIKLSASLDFNTKEKYQAFLIKEYHAIEKGLALPITKIGFGQKRIQHLIKILDIYIEKFGVDDITDITIATLKEYSDFETTNQNDRNILLPIIANLVKSYNNKRISCNSGGTKIILKSDIENTIKMDFDSFFKSRFSTRDFTNTRVPREQILSAIDTARYTPSVCNRQPWKCYLIDHTNPTLRDKFLKVQNGNNGFGDTISALIVVTGKLSSFFSYERNQVYIDGGMFSMSIIMALHSKGLGACCLNTSYTSKRTKDFLAVKDIDKDCVPIMFIAVGNLKDNYKVATSKRKPIEKTVEIC